MPLPRVDPARGTAGTARRRARRRRGRRRRRRPVHVEVVRRCRVHRPAPRPRSGAATSASSSGGQERQAHRRRCIRRRTAGRYSGGSSWAVGWKHGRRPRQHGRQPGPGRGVQVGEDDDGVERAGPVVEPRLQARARSGPCSRIHSLLQVQRHAASCPTRTRALRRPNTRSLAGRRTGRRCTVTPSTLGRCPAGSTLAQST